MSGLPKLPIGIGGEDRIRVQIPVASDKYQAYLDALKERERLREENGEDTLEGVVLVREAVQEVDSLAKKIFQREKSN